MRVVTAMCSRGDKCCPKVGCTVSEEGTRRDQPGTATPFIAKKMYMHFLLLLLVVSQVHGSCDTNERRLGCRIQNRRCSCDDYGCSSEYRYSSFDECQKALRGKRSDSCHPNPCGHGGSCIQISQAPGFKCRCEGTGFFGARCSRSCPRPGSAPFGDVVFPYECIVI